VAERLEQFAAPAAAASRSIGRGPALRALDAYASRDRPGKCTPHTSCTCAACIRGQSAAMMRRKSGRGSAGPCSANSRPVARACRGVRSGCKIPPARRAGAQPGRASQRLGRGAPVSPSGAAICQPSQFLPHRWSLRGITPVRLGPFLRSAHRSCPHKPDFARQRPRLHHACHQGGADHSMTTSGN
jgi:hypothetical protein